MKNKIINNVLKDIDINFSEDLKAFTFAVIICFVLTYIAKCLAFI